MTTTRISTTLSHGVTLNTGSYGSALTVTRSGGLIASDSGSFAVTGDSSGDYVLNYGTLHGGGGGAYLLIGSINNIGTITGGSIGIETEQGDVENEGQVFGVSIGLVSQNYLVDNSGNIAGGVVGAKLQGDFIANLPGSTISGGTTGLLLQNGGGTNYALITGGGIGAVLDSSSFTNDGSISGNTYGVYLSASSTGAVLKTPFGARITGGKAGIAMYGGTVFNNGVISGTQDGIYLKASSFAANVTSDAGLISGATYAIDGVDSFSLTLDNNPDISGNVRDRAGDGLLALNDYGTLSGIGGSVTGFSTINFLQGAAWTLEGTGAGFDGDSVSGFAPGDLLDVTDLAFTGDGVLRLGESGVLDFGADQISFGSAYAGEAVSFTSDGHGGTDLTIAPCFCPGTRIRTPVGPVAVEDLRVGDMVETAFSGPQPVIWIGRRAYEGTFIAGNHMALPIRIRRNALGENVPSRDLFLSPGHALAEGGVLVHAWRFVNGMSITQADSVERVEYFHIELEEHAVIFAEDTPVESFLDNGCRAQFQNATETPVPPAAGRKPCLPQLDEGYYLAQLQARINARAGITAPCVQGRLRGALYRAGETIYGWAQDESAPEAPVELEIVFGELVVGRFLANRFRADVRAAGIGSGCHAFEVTLPPLSGALTIRRASDGAVLTAARQQAA